MEFLFPPPGGPTSPATIVFHLGVGAYPPLKAHPSDAGWDLRLAEPVRILLGDTVYATTRITAVLPSGTFALITSRGSLAKNRGLVILPGVIDAGYRGEWLIQVHNPTLPEGQGGVTIEVEAGARLAQAVILPVLNVTWQRLDDPNSIPAGDRPGTGPGSTGP